MAKEKSKSAKSKPTKSKASASKASAKSAAKAKDAKKLDKKGAAKAAGKATPKAHGKGSEAPVVKSEVKAKPVKTTPKPAAKPSLDAAKKGPKKDKTKKPKTGREEIEIEDDFEAEDFDGGSEIAEYEDELKAVESEDEESDSDSWDAETVDKESEEVVLTDAEGNRYCRARDCDQIASVDAYCRYHYLLFWKKIQVRKKILQDGKLERYVEELTSRYPDKFLEMIRRDLRTEKDFLGAIQELEIDEAGLENEFEEDTQTYIDEVRGMGESTNVDEEEF